MLGLPAWGDGLIVILFEFLDDDTKLAQSCRNWLYVQPQDSQIRKNGWKGRAMASNGVHTR